MTPFRRSRRRATSNDAANLNDSIDSMGWSASHIEPSARRRVSIESIAAGDGSSPDTSFRSPTSPLVAAPFRVQHNPYRYNVLGANASPDFAARTTPLPTYLAAAYSNSFGTSPPSALALAPPQVLACEEPRLSPVTHFADATLMARRYVNGRPVPVARAILATI